MGKYQEILCAVLACGCVLSSFNFINTEVFALGNFDPANFYDKECADRMFDKYLKDAEPEFDKYMDKADDIPFPDSENDVNSYLDSLDPLAEEYIDNLDPYAEDYIDNLELCMN